MSEFNLKTSKLNDLVIEINHATNGTLQILIFFLSAAVRHQPDSLRAIYGDPYNDSINAVHGSGNNQSNYNLNDTILIHRISS